MQLWFRAVVFSAAAILCMALALPAVAGAQTVTIRLMSFQRLVIEHDLPPKGKGNKGDSIDFKDLLKNRTAQFGKKTGAPVGYDAGIVRYTSPTKQEMLVIATFPGVGTITFQGELLEQSDGNIVLPITSGTGGFKGAHGTVTIGPGENKSPNTYKVTVPGTALSIGPGPIA